MSESNGVRERQFYQDMLQRGDCRITDTEEHDALLALIRFHPEAAYKVGCGISHFEVRSHGTVMSNRTAAGNHLNIYTAFFVVRVDGSFERWSYRDAYNSSFTGNKETADNARRRRQLLMVVRDQKLAMQGAYMNARKKYPHCALSGVDLNKPGVRVDVHHREPFTFQNIMREFNAKFYGIELADYKLNSLWWTFHRRLAELDFVEHEAHVEEHRNGVRPVTKPAHIILRKWI